MDTFNYLRSIQKEFIQRLNTNQDEELLCSRYEGNYSELKIINLDELVDVRNFAWCMVDKFKQNKARGIFSNHLKGKLGELAVKHCLGNYISSVNYEILPSGDGKVDFRINSNNYIRMQVKTRYGNTETAWKFSLSEIEVNEVLVCVLIHDKEQRVSFDEFQSEYRLVIAGFIPSELLKEEISNSKLIAENSSAITIKIQDLLHGNGLKTYLETLEFNHYSQWKEDKIKTECGDICSVMISQTKKTVVTGDTIHSINFWDLENKKLQHTIESTRRQEGDGHRGDVNALALRPDNQVFASASHDKTIKIWDSKEKKLLKTLTGHSRNVFSLTYTYDGSKLISGGDDGTIKIWDFIKYKLEFKLNVNDSVNTVSVHPNDNIFAAAGKDKYIRFWKISEEPILCQFLAHDDQIRNVCFSKDGLFLVSCSYDRTIKIWNTSDKNLLKGISPNLKYEKFHEVGIHAITISPDSQFLAGIDKNGTVYLYQLNTGQLIRKYPGNFENSWARSHAISFSMDGKLLIAGAKQVIRIWQRLV